ncbi:hypothetical protein NIES593_01490 [Hydrococcus rivularis NIES-593]|uniref:Uncharacterized protein n=1 Tax=Hydrococcus rivularis NIES-593 TaxID=1921803 RepID=A0A1U7HT43_9CYAN|nr:hypothetical protein [Hydrococcus rivularis]OKH26751.1 hypothetical protein NIES593_01490 [Hydrococcus rivularis NIES-593]
MHCQASYRRAIAFASQKSPNNYQFAALHIVKLYVKESDRVFKGQIIARMNGNWGRKRDRNSYTHSFLR